MTKKLMILGASILQLPAIEKAKEMITSGKAKAKLEQFIEDSNK